MNDINKNDWNAWLILMTKNYKKHLLEQQKCCTKSIIIKMRLFGLYSYLIRDYKI